MDDNQKIITPSYYVRLNDDKRIVKLTRTQQDEDQFMFEFPNEFKPNKIYDYKIVDGELVHEPFVYPENEPSPSYEEQLAEANAKIAELTETMALFNDVMLETIVG